MCMGHIMVEREHDSSNRGGKDGGLDGYVGKSFLRKKVPGKV